MKRVPGDTHRKIFDGFSIKLGMDCQTGIPMVLLAVTVYKLNQDPNKIVTIPSVTTHLMQQSNTSWFSFGRLIFNAEIGSTCIIPSCSHRSAISPGNYPTTDIWRYTYLIREIVPPSTINARRTLFRKNMDNIQILYTSCVLLQLFYNRSMNLLYKAT